MQTKNFIPKIICNNKKYIPTTKYVRIITTKKAHEKRF